MSDPIQNDSSSPHSDSNSDPADPANLPDADQTIIDPSLMSPRTSSEQFDPADDQTILETPKTPQASQVETAQNQSEGISTDAVNPYDKTIDEQATLTNQGSDQESNFATDQTMTVSEQERNQFTDIEKTTQDNEDPSFIISESLQQAGNPFPVATSNSGNQTVENIGSAGDTEVERPVTASLLSLQLATGKKSYIGRFEVDSILGSGAFGTVYLAYDPHLDRYVAIKVAKTGILPEKTDVDRFKREAKAAAKLRHPNIVGVHEIGSIGGSNFIAYDFVRGRTLKDVLKEEGSLEPTRASLIVEKIAAAIFYAHENGIIHRDLKPENILLDANDEPHVLDFGLARADDSDTTRTREGAMMGSPAYMSPEQASGKSHLADARSDIWGLGTIFYELLSAERPFKGNITEILIAVKETPHYPLRSLNPKIDLDLETICSKCLEKAPESRYQTGNALAEELRRWRKGEPILARRLSFFQTVWRWAKRNQTVASLILAIFVVLLIGSVVSTYFAIDAHSKKALAIQAQEDRALTQVASLMTSPPESIPMIIQMIEPFRESTVPSIKKMIASHQTTPHGKFRLLIGLSRLEPDPQQKEIWKEQLKQALLSAPPGDLKLIREQFEVEFEKRIPEEWQFVFRETTPVEQRFNMAGILAHVDPKSQQWDSLSGDLVGFLLSVDSMKLEDWLQVFRPVRHALLRTLKQKYTSAEIERERIQSAIILSQMFDDRPAVLQQIAIEAEVSQFPLVANKLKEHRELTIAKFRKELVAPIPKSVGAARLETIMQERANAACVLLHLRDFEGMKQAFKLAPDPRIRTTIMLQAGACGVTPKTLLDALSTETDPEILAAICLTLGHYSSEKLLESSRRKAIPLIEKAYENYPSAGLHSNIEWLLRRWKFEERLVEFQQKANLKKTLAQLQSHPENIRAASWVSPSDIRFAVIKTDQQFQMGSPKSEVGHLAYERQHNRKIPRQFAIAIHEVTVEQFLKFKKTHHYDKNISSSKESPINSITWLDAVHYCRWLSEQENISDSQMCYPPVEKMKRNTKLPLNLLERTGYRLPTAAEWEFACRAGTTTSRHFGETRAYQKQFAWYNSNSNFKTHAVGSKLPNPFGLFDTQGNVNEWCQTWYKDNYPKENKEGFVLDILSQQRRISRELRGGSYRSSPELLRSADRDEEVEISRSPVIGFRIARTIQSTHQTIKPKKKSEKN